MNLQRVSIVIPHRDQPVKLQACLDKLLELDYGDQEILVVDNGSQVSLDFLDTYPVKLLHSDSQPSPYVARNIGISHSSENIIVLLDVNALVHQGWLEKALSLLKEDTIIGGIPQRPDLHVLDIFQRFDYLYSIIDPVDDASLRALPATNLFFHKKVWEAVGPFPEVRSLGDMAWTIRARKKGYTLMVDPAIRFSYPFKSRKAFATKFRRLGGGKAENRFIRYPMSYVLKNFLPPSPLFVRRMQHKNHREKMELSVIQIFLLCYWVKINYGLGAMRQYTRNF